MHTQWINLLGHGTNQFRHTYTCIINRICHKLHPNNVYLGHISLVVKDLKKKSLTPNNMKIIIFPKNLFEDIKNLQEMVKNYSA